MRKAHIIAAFFCILAAVGIAFSSDDIGERGATAAQVQFRHDGDMRQFFNVECSSQAWTVVVSSEPRSRVAVFNAPAINRDFVCLSSSTTVGTCTDTTAALQLVTSTYFSDFTTTGWACRSQAGDSRILTRILGFRAYHSKD